VFPVASLEHPPATKISKINCSLIPLRGRELMAAVAPVSFSAIVAGSHHAIEGVQMSTTVARLFNAISLSLIALLLSGSIVHAQGVARQAPMSTASMPKSLTSACSSTAMVLFRRSVTTMWSR
jgi:hypothetical protein